MKMCNRCGKVCGLCPRVIFSQAVTFVDGTLTINLPAGSYGDGERYCVVIVQPIPEETTISAAVVITIGEGTEEYPLNTRACRQVTAAGIRARAAYPVRVSTSATGGVFKMLTDPCCAPDNRLTVIDGTAPATGGGA